MKTVIITDGKYRSSIAAVRALGRAGFQVVITQTKADVKTAPPVFFSKYVDECIWIEGSCQDSEYSKRLQHLCEGYKNGGIRPVLFCVGAGTLNMVSRERENFGEVCDFLISPQEVLDALNDKAMIHSRAEELNMPVPKEFESVPDRWPVVIKPHCGEKFGLKARERYLIAQNVDEYYAGIAKLSPYDSAPIVQEKVEGSGFGASLLMDQDSRLICAICHRRIREYPIAGGPSACCESIYDLRMVEQAYELLKSFHFVGIAMVEFKGEKILEVNPRVWGSFPLTEQAKSPFAILYAKAAAGERIEYEPDNYRSGVRMRFTLNDGMASLSLIKSGRIKEGFAGLRDIFMAEEALRAEDDPGPLRQYLKQAMRGK